MTSNVFKVNQSASFSTDDSAVEAGRQPRGDPLPTTGCTSCKRSTVRNGSLPESVSRSDQNRDGSPHRVHDINLNAQLV
jgi:hypothetical protein